MGLLDTTVTGDASVPGGRSRAAAALLDDVGGIMEEAGITRVANITGLDTIGVPVWMAVRPNSRGLSVSQGKGLTHDDARASAVMESLEHWHAETIDQPIRMACHDDLVDQSPDPDLLARSTDSTFRSSTVVPWIGARDVRTDEPSWVPFELVHADTRLPRMPGSGAFLCNTNGLASGATVIEAVLHALCEVIERDAHALWSLLPRESADDTRIDLASIIDPGAVHLLDAYAAAHIDVVLWDMTSDIGVPACRCVIVDREAVAEHDPLPPSYGAGCHPDPGVALVRALTEAAQSRLTSIAGSRDDLTRPRYRETLSAAAVEGWQREAERVAGTCAWPSEATGAFRPADPIARRVDDLLDSLSAVGLHQVLAVDLSKSVGVGVAKVIVPGLEPPSTAGATRPSPRRRARLDELGYSP